MPKLESKVDTTVEPERPITVNVPFTVVDTVDPTITYTDALTFTLDEFQSLSAADVKAIRAGTHKLARARFTAWRRAISDAQAAAASEPSEDAVLATDALSAAEQALDAVRIALKAAQVAQSGG